MKWFLFVIFVSSCGTLDRVGTKLVDGASKKDVDYKIIPLLEGLKVLDYRVDLLAKDLSATNEHFKLFNSNFKNFNMTLNTYIIQNDRWRELIESRIVELENHHK